jgi:lysophospholipase L1-like esterase
MRRIIVLFSGLVALAAPATAHAGAYVLGDSIGEGVAIASGLKGLARISVHIRGPKALAQISATPPGSTVFIVLGTNDADSGIKGIEKSIDGVVEAAAKRQLTMYWIGPHCVHAKFDARSRELDQILRDRLASTSVKYISMRDPKLCASNFYEPDGIHLKMSGYRYMWDRVRTAVADPSILVADQGAPREQGNIETTGAVALRASAAPSFTAPSATAPSVAAPSSVAAPPSARADRRRGPAGRLVLEVHTPSAVPTAPILWVKAGN